MNKETLTQFLENSQRNLHNILCKTEGVISYLEYLERVLAYEDVHHPFSDEERQRISHCKEYLSLTTQELTSLYLYPITRDQQTKIVYNSQVEVDPGEIPNVPKIQPGASEARRILLKASHVVYWYGTKGKDFRLEDFHQRFTTTNKSRLYQSMCDDAIENHIGALEMVWPEQKRAAPKASYS